MIKKDLNFCEQILQAVAVSYKKLEIFIVLIFNFNSSFFSSIFHFNIPISRGFLSVSNSLIFLDI